MLPELKFQHRCYPSCGYNGEIVTVRPNVEGSVYYLIEPTCIKSNAKLVLIREGASAKQD